jgi:2'-5' RNA ligase
MNDDTIRAFLALEIPDRVRSYLAAAREDLRHEMPRARWTRSEGWHLTLKFLGETPRPALADLGAEIAPRVRGLGRVTVKLGRSGFFPSSARPRVAWVGGSVEGAEKVVEAVEEAAEVVGFARERRRWSAHLTMARLKSQWSKNAVDRFLEWGDQLEVESFSCPEVVLYESDLQPGGAVYTALERFSIE